MKKLWFSFYHGVHTHNRIEFIVASFNLNTRKALHVITIYNPPTKRLDEFFHTLDKFVSMLHVLAQEL